MQRLQQHWVVRGRARKPLVQRRRSLKLIVREVQHDLREALELLVHAETGGLRAAHPQACSSCDATRISTSSCPYAATSCTPIGSPSEFHDTGSEIAGWPVALKGGVKGTRNDAVAPAPSGF